MRLNYYYFIFFCHMQTCLWGCSIQPVFIKERWLNNLDPASAVYTHGLSGPALQPKELHSSRTATCVQAGSDFSSTPKWKEKSVGKPSVCLVLFSSESSEIWFGNPYRQKTETSSKYHNTGTKSVDNILTKNCCC